MRPPVMLELPVVRPRALPPGDLLAWRDGADLPAVVVVAVTGALGAALGASGLAGGTAGPDALVALSFVVVGVLAVVAAVAELVREERIRIADGDVTVEWRTLRGREAWRTPLTEYAGLATVDRQRRFFVRNQGLPATGRRGPVTEFVVVLRHASRRERDVELVRAQPSLATLRAMHSARGGRQAADVRECERVAGEYREALRRLCDALGLPALVTGADGAVAPVAPASLDLWLEPAAAPDPAAR